MSIDPAILELMNDTVLIEPLAGRDRMGGEQFGTATGPWQALVEGRVRRVLTENGEERVSSVTVTFAAPTGVRPGDRLTLPARFVPRKQRALAVTQSPRDQDGDIAAYEAAYTA